MDGFACVLYGRVPQDRDLPRLRVHLQVYDVSREGATGASRVHICVADDRSAGVGQLAGKLLESNPQLRVGLMLEDAVQQLDLVLGLLPELRCSTDHLPLYVLGGLVAGPAGLERRAAASGHRRVPDGLCVSYLRIHILDGNAQNLRKLLRSSWSEPADVHRPYDQTDHAIVVYVGYGTCRTGAINPEPRRDASPSIRPVKGGRIVVVVPGRLCGLDAADRWIDQSSDASGALLGGVHDAELKWVNGELLTQLIHHRFGGESPCRGAWGPIRGRLRLVIDDVVGVDPGVFNAVGGEHAYGCGAHRRAREGARLEPEVRVGSRQAPVLGGAHLDLHVRPGRWARGLQHLRTGHR